MREFASALTSGKRWPTLIERGAMLWGSVVAVGLLMMMTSASGCDCGEEVDHEQAVRHAEVWATHHADHAIVFAREWTLLHEQSERQRQAREQLMYLEEIDGRIVDPPPGEVMRRKRELERLQHLTDDSSPATDDINSEFP